MSIPLFERDDARRELHAWALDARDAAEACKLAIVRLNRPEDIAVVGEHLDQHERFAAELERIVGLRANDEDPRDVPYHDRPVVGATLRDDEVLAAIEQAERDREARIAAALARNHDARLNELLGEELRRARERSAWAATRAREIARATAA